MNPKKIRLTKPEANFLREIAAHPGKLHWQDDPGLKRLVDVEFVTLGDAGMFRCTAYLTDAGREWLEAHKQ